MVTWTACESPRQSKWSILSPNVEIDIARLEKDIVEEPPVKMKRRKRKKGQTNAPVLVEIPFYEPIESSPQFRASLEDATVDSMIDEEEKEGEEENPQHSCLPGREELFVHSIKIDEQMEPREEEENHQQTSLLEKEEYSVTEENKEEEKKKEEKKKEEEEKEEGTLEYFKVLEKKENEKAPEYLENGQEEQVSKTFQTVGNSELNLALCAEEEMRSVLLLGTEKPEFNADSESDESSDELSRALDSAFSHFAESPSVEVSPAFLGVHQGPLESSDSTGERMEEELLIEEVLRTLQETSFVEEIHLGTSLPQERRKIDWNGLIRVPADRRDYFALSVNDDKTPLALPMFHETIQVAPTSSLEVISTEDLNRLQETLRFTQSSSHIKNAAFIRLEDGEVVLALHGISRPRDYLSLRVPLQRTLEDQKSLCEGCQEPLGPTPRYCDMTGSYFCTLCHQGDSFYVPHRILHHWDFGQYPLSDRACQLIRASQSLPLFDIASLVPELYQKSSDLRKIKTLRQQLCYMREYVATCTKHPFSLSMIASGRQHLLLDRHVSTMWSRLCH